MGSLRHKEQKSSLHLFLSFSLGSGKRSLVLIKFTSAVISGEPTWLCCVTKSMNLMLLKCLCSTWAVCAQNRVLYFKPDYPVVGQYVWSQLETQNCIPVQKWLIDTGGVLKNRLNVIYEGAKVCCKLSSELVCSHLLWMYSQCLCPRYYLACDLNCLKIKETNYYFKLGQNAEPIKLLSSSILGLPTKKIKATILMWISQTFEHSSPI